MKPLSRSVSSGRLPASCREIRKSIRTLARLVGVRVPPSLSAPRLDCRIGPSWRCSRNWSPGPATGPLACARVPAWSTETFAALEYAANSCVNLRDAILCVSFSVPAQRGRRDRADGTRRPRPLALSGHRRGRAAPREANDFVVACAITFARMHAGAPEVLEAPSSLLEVHFTQKATDAAAYAGSSTPR